VRILGPSYFPLSPAPSPSPPATPGRPSRSPSFLILQTFPPPVPYYKRKSHSAFSVCCNDDGDDYDDDDSTAIKSIDNLFPRFKALVKKGASVWLAPALLSSPFLFSFCFLFFSYPRSLCRFEPNDFFFRRNCDLYAAPLCAYIFSDGRI
jgi:hypothetical protein